MEGSDGMDANSTEPCIEPAGAAEGVKEKSSEDKALSATECLICFTPFTIKNNKDENNDKNDANDNDSPNENSSPRPHTFLLGKLLDLSSEQLDALECKWTDPGQWSYEQLLCSNCSQDANQAYQLYSKVIHLKKEILSLKDKIQDTLRKNCNDNSNSSTSSATTNVTPLVDEIRQKYLFCRFSSSVVARARSILNETEIGTSMSKIPAPPTATTPTEDNCYIIPTLQPIKLEPVDFDGDQTDGDGHLDDYFFDPSGTNMHDDEEDDDEWSSTAGSLCQVKYENRDDDEELSQEIKEERRYPTRTRTSRTSGVSNNSGSGDDDNENHNKAKSKSIPKAMEKKDFKCPLCPSGFPSSHQMNSHYIKVHLRNLSDAKTKKTGVVKAKAKRIVRKRRSSSAIDDDDEDDDEDYDGAKKRTRTTDRKVNRKYQFKCPDSKCLQHFPSEHFRDAHHRRRHLGIKLCFICNKCGKAYDRNQSLEAHLKNCDGDGTLLYPEDPRLQEVQKFKCPKCPRHFPSEVTREAHLKRYHMGIVKPFECSRCKKGFRAKKVQIEHETRCLKKEGTDGLNEEGNGSDSDVNAPFDAADDFLSGLFDDDDNPHVAPAVAAATAGKAKLGKAADVGAWTDDEDEKEDPKDDDYKPEKKKSKITPSSSKTGQATSKRKSVARKTSTSTPGEYKCTVKDCVKVFRFQEVLDGHVRKVHEGIKKPFKCSICPKTFSKFYVMKSHEATHVKGKESSGSRSFKCGLCNGKDLGSKGALKTHLTLIHGSTTSLKCNKCDVVCRNNSRLVRHLRQIHEKARDYICDLCGETFTQSCFLKFHRHSNHYKELDLDPYRCNICDKMFKQPYQLQDHTKLMHEKAYSYICEICSKGFTKKSALKTHQQVHTKEKPCYCQVCGKGLSRVGDLERHMRLHTGERPFVCEQCGKQYTDANALRKHTRKHEPPKFPCERCDKIFYTITNLKTHVKGVHETDKKHRKTTQRHSFNVNTNANTNSNSGSVSDSLELTQLDNIPLAQAPPITHNQNQFHTISTASQLLMGLGLPIVNQNQSQQDNHSQYGHGRRHAVTYDTFANNNPSCSWFNGSR